MISATKVPDEVSGKFRESMRIAAASISLVTTVDEDGKYHGMAVTSAMSLSMEPPSMMVAINKSASIHPVIVRTGRFSLNMMAKVHTGLLESFSRSDLRDERFNKRHWGESAAGLPILVGAPAVHLCTVEETHDYGTHTVFFGCIEDVIMGSTASRCSPPLVWLNGALAPIA